MDTESPGAGLTGVCELCSIRSQARVLMSSEHCTASPPWPYTHLFLKPGSNSYCFRTSFRCGSFPSLSFLLCKMVMTQHPNPSPGGCRSHHEHL